MHCVADSSRAARAGIGSVSEALFITWLLGEEANGSTHDAAMTNLANMSVLLDEANPGTERETAAGGATVSHPDMTTRYDARLLPRGA